MSISSDLYKLRRYSQIIISQKKLRISPDDLINEVVISLHDLGKPYCFDTFKREVSRMSWELKHYQPQILEFKEVKKGNTFINEDKYCIGCNQNFPLQMFYTYKNKKNGFTCPYKLCKNCHNKRKWKMTKENPSSLLKQRQRALKTYYKFKKERNRKTVEYRKKKRMEMKLQSMGS